VAEILEIKYVQDVAFSVDLTKEYILSRKMHTVICTMTVHGMKTFLNTFLALGNSHWGGVERDDG
jgi:hypothetical protein